MASARLDTKNGISYWIYHMDHHPPHFHAKYGGMEVEISIKTLEVLNGQMPPQQLKKIRKWAEGKQDILLLIFEERQETGK